MFLDSLVTFSSAQSLVTTATTTLVSSTTYDVTSAGVGTAPSMIGGVNASTGAAQVIGFDIGTGDGFAIPEVEWSVPTAATPSGATMQIKLQAAADNGSNVPGTWVDIYASKAFVASDLVANTINSFQVPPVPATFGTNAPRFYRLAYVIGTATYTAGTISANIVLNPTTATRVQDYPGNFVS